MAPGKSTETRLSLYQLYPVNSIIELTLNPDREVVSGLVYCTDEISNSVVIKKSLPHTTLSCDIRIINASSISEHKVIAKQAPLSKTSSEGTEVAVELAAPLNNVSKKSVLEKERRAMKLSGESLRHINQKATLEGQAVFDRLLKACNEVIWEGESILVLNSIRVDPPYTIRDCKLTQSEENVLNEDTFDRVKRIVGVHDE